MRFSKSIETQLTAAANAADRANRPGILVIAPGVLLLIALVLTLVVYQRFGSAKAILSSRMIERGNVREIIDYAHELENAHPDPGKLFPVNAYMDANISDVAKVIWDEANKVSVSPKIKKSLGLNKQLVRSDVDVNFTSSVSIDDAFRFIHEVVTKEELAGVFLSKFDLRPVQGGWVGSLRFSLYERAR